MSLRIFLPIVLLSLVVACTNGTHYLGYPVTETSFKVDGGQIIKIPMTRAGALPVGNDQYKIETAGVNASISKSSAEDSQLTWVFSFLSKSQQELEYVQIERITEESRLELVVRDDAPTLKGSSWFGRSAASNMTKTAQPWIYSANDSTFIFKFTIKAKSHDALVMYQPSTISKQVKSVYLNAMR